MCNEPPLRMPLNDTGSWGKDPIEQYQIRHYNNGLQYAKRRRHAVDIGAHVGIFTRRFARDFERVTAIEPVNHELLRQNTEHLNNVNIYPFGADRTNGVSYIHNPVDANGSGWWELTDRETDKTVSIVTVDSLRLREVDYIKVDTQAREREVLEGAQETIELCKPIIHVETKDQQLLQWIEYYFDYKWQSKYIKDHILLPVK